MSIREKIKTLYVMSEELKNLIAEKLNDIAKAKQILAIREVALDQARDALNKAKVNLEKETLRYSITCKCRNEARENLAHLEKVYDSVIKSREGLLKEIEDLENNPIYLIDPSYSGELPKGNYFSTVKIERIERLTVLNPSSECLSEPNLKDMVFLGIDSYKEYATMLRFVALCKEFMQESVEFKIITDDERLKILIKDHVESHMMGVL